MDVADALDAADESTFARRARMAAADSEPGLREFLVSNELWGGAGSIADQAGLGGERNPRRRRIEAAMIALGREQIRQGPVNIRTRMWVEAFEGLHRDGI